MKFDFASSRKQAEKDNGLESGGAFKPAEGENKIRILSAPTLLVDSFVDKKTGTTKQRAKYLCWIYDHKEERVRLYFMPPMIYKMIEAFQTSEQYGFDEVPMPYDVFLNAKNAGTIDVEYILTPARTNTEIPFEAEVQLSKKESIEEVIKKIKAKSGNPDGIGEGQQVVEEEHNPLDAMVSEPARNIAAG